MGTLPYMPPEEVIMRARTWTHGVTAGHCVTGTVASFVAPHILEMSGRGLSPWVISQIQIQNTCQALSSRADPTFGSLLIYIYML